LSRGLKLEITHFIKKSLRQKPNSSSKILH
jgi:hypothetical protein